MEAWDIRRYLPRRERESHKGDFGKLLLLCGSTGFTGAARMAARAAMRTGAGLVFLGVPEAIYPIVAAALDEPVVFPLPCDTDGRLSAAALPEIRARLENADVVLAGPGMGQTADTREIIFSLLRETKIPLVLDADGINVLQGHIDVLRTCTAPVILTPHNGEFARLYSGEPAGRYQETARLARETGCIVLRKGHRTLITDGVRVYRNHTGNPGMAKGGSGDVLSGIIAALLGQKVPPLEAAALGAYLHGAAGDLCAKQKGEYSLLPTDLIEALPEILK